MLKSITSRLQTKLIVAFVLVLLIPIAIIGIYELNATSASLTNTAISNEQESNQNDAQRIQDALVRYTNNVQFLANSPELEKYASALSGNDASLIKASLSDMQKSFLTYAEIFGVYDQILFLNKAGQEVVRVNFKDGKAILVGDDNLRSVADSNFFQNAINLQEGQIYIAPLALYQENGKIEQPYKPILRYSAPVFTKTGSVIGVVVTNVPAQSLFSLVGGKDITTEKAYLVDSDGTYLTGPDPSQLYGRDLKTDSNFLKDHPQDGPKFLAANTGLSFGSAENPDLVQVYTRVIVPNQGTSLQWTLYHTYPISVVLSEVHSQQLTVLALALIALLIAIAIAFFITRSIVQPIQKLALTANEISVGNWNIEVPSAGNDEIGQLATAFGKMSKELQTIYDSLENRVRERTLELETVAEVSTATSTILDIDKLLKSVVELTKSSFGYYHAHIYLLDEAGENLVLAAGAGEAGRVMKAEGRRIPLNHPHSLVARAGRTKQGVIANDVRREPDFLPYRLLPDTRSEMAVPMTVADTLIGVLDVQSEKVDRFTPDDIRVKTTLAGQTAIAIRNATAFNETQSAREEAKILYDLSAAVNAAENEQQLVEAIVQYVIQPHTWTVTLTMFENAKYDTATYVQTVATWQKDGVVPAMPSKYPLATVQFMAQMDRHEINFVNDINTDPRLDEVGIASLQRIGAQALIFAPLTVGNKWIGSLSMLSPEPHVYTDYEKRIVRGIMKQVTTAVERLRLLNQIHVRASELETVAMVSAVTASILDVDELLQTVVDLTKASFDLYHAHIYLLDEKGEYLVLTAGAGEAGRIMKERRRSIAVNNERSLVARAARTLDAVIVNDVTQVTDYLPNPLLPETRSEMAIPIAVADTLIGILDVQSQQVDRFTDADVNVTTTLTAQVGIAVQNARAFAQTQEAREEAKTLYDLSTAINAAESEQELVDAVVQYGLHSDTLSVSLSIYENADYDTATYSKITAQWPEDPTADAYAKYPVTIFPFIAHVDRHDIYFINDVNNAPFLDEVSVATFNGFNVQAIIFAPLTVGNRWVGSLSLLSSELHVYTDREKRMMRGVTRQLTTAIERLRLIQQTNIRATELETVAKVSAVTASILDVDELLQTVVDLTKTSFNLYHAHIYLLDEEGIYLVLTAGAGEPGRIMRNEGRRLAVSNERSLVARAARTLEGVIVNDVTQAEDFLPNALLPNTHSELAVPMIVGDHLLGVLDVQAEELDRFTVADARIQTTLAEQIAIAIENARYFAQIKQAEAENEKRAEKLAIVAKVSTAASSNLDLDEVMQIVVDLTKQEFNLYHANIYLLDEAEYNLILVAGAGDVGRSQKAEQRNLNIQNEYSIVARTARSQTEIIVDDVALLDDYLPNPLLPKTRSELTMPLILGNRLIGVLDMQSDHAHYFTVDDVTVLSTLASQVAVAVENARIYQKQVETAEQLRQLDRLKSEFLANMSHELRTPLNSIIGYAEVMLDGIDGDLPEDALEDIGAIHGSGQHLLSMINDILDLAKIEAGRMELDLDTVHFADVATEVQQITSILLKDKPVQLVIDLAPELPDVWADQVRLRQILNNLVSNASKFTNEGEIRVRAAYAGERQFGDGSTKDMILVEVIDTGEGIAPENLDLVFQQFRQADSSSTRKAGGTGMGLAITRHLVQMHGGELSVSSTVGEGSNFWFTIPAVPISVAGD
ncbi:MAG: GAF domain-containing protein [Chloroflexota bacterium]